MAPAHARALFDSLLVVSAGAGGCARASRVSAEHVVHLLPQLLSRHLEECRTFHVILKSGMNQ